MPEEPQPNPEYARIFFNLLRTNAQKVIDVTDLYDSRLSKDMAEWTRADIEFAFSSYKAASNFLQLLSQFREYADEGGKKKADERIRSMERLLNHMEETFISGILGLQK